MIYYDKDFVSIHFFPEHKFAYSQWHRFARSEDYHDYLATTLELHTKHEIHYWLSDQREQKVIKPSDREYTTSVFMPKFIPIARLKKVAIVLANDLFARLSVDKILQVSEGMVKFDMKHFATVPEAIEWLGIDKSLVEQD